MELVQLEPYLSKKIDPKLQQLRVSIYEDMIVHTRGLKPETLLKITRPNEPDEVLKYRLDTYQSITRDPILRALNSAYHLIKQSDYKVIMGEITSEYLAVKRFDSIISTNKLDLYDLIFKSFLQIDIEDPNGVMLIYPINPDDRNLPASLSNPTKRIDVDIKYISSEEIVYVDDNILKYHVGNVKVGKELVPAYNIVTNTDIWYYKPISKGEKGVFTYELEIIYNHNFGSIPYRFLGGIETIIESEQKGYFGKEGHEEKYRVYDSFFTAYNSWANKAILASSDTDAVRIRFSFPIMEVMATVCTSCNGRKEQWSCGNRIGCDHISCSTIACNTCGGNGVVSSFSPYSTIIKSPPKAINGEVATDFPTVKFYTPDFNAVGVNKDFWYDMMDKAEQSITIYQSLNSQSGVAKEYDLEQKRDFVAVLGDNCMNLLEFAGKYIAMYLNDTERFYVIKPTRYEIRNQEMILNEIKAVSAINNNLSKSLTKEYIENEFEGKDLRVMSILLENDIYYGFTLDELKSLQAMQMLDVPAFQFHFKGYNVLNNLLNDEKNKELTNLELYNLANSTINPTIA